MSSINAFLSPSHFVLAGPESCLDASTLSFSGKRDSGQTRPHLWRGRKGKEERVGEEGREKGERKEKGRKVGREGGK